MKEWLKLLLFVCLVLWFTRLTLFPNIVNAAATTPSVSTFYFKNGNDEKFYVTTWVADNVQCSVATSDDRNLPPNISCVKK